MKQRKFQVLVSAPVFNRSGYGQAADAYVPAIIEYPHFDTKVIPTAWGICVPRVHATSRDELIKSRTITKLDQIGNWLPDIHITIDMPENVKPKARIFSMNFCAGLEVDRCPDVFMNAVNNWNLSIVTSKHSRDGYFNSSVKPAGVVEICPWCIDADTFKISAACKSEYVNDLFARHSIKEAFLYVGQRTHPNPEMDRKNALTLLRTYCAAFANKASRPALLMKWHGTSFATADRDVGIRLIAQIKNQFDKTLPIFLLHGEMSDEEMSALYNHPAIIACLSATRGEGLGGSLLQSSVCGKPTIAGDWGGHLDYLDNRAILVPGEVKEIPPQAVSNWFMPGSKWFEIDAPALMAAMANFYYGDRVRHVENALSLAKDNARRFSMETMQRNLHRIFDKYLFGK